MRPGLLNVHDNFGRALGFVYFDFFSVFQVFAYVLSHEAEIKNIDSSEKLLVLQESDEDFRRGACGVFDECCSIVDSGFRV